MALILHSHESQAFPAIKIRGPLPASDSVSPILAISLFCIIASVFMLVSYFIFLTKWFHNFNQLNLLGRLPIMQTRYSNDSFSSLTLMTLSCGLEESRIRDIPIQRFSREFVEKSFNGCVICLGEFQEEDMLRVLPICSHGFHLDCIDIWLQTNFSCPLCRTSIFGKTRAPAEAIMAPSSSPQNPLLLSANRMDDEDFVVIELRREDEMERNDFRGETSRKKWRHVSIMGDEAIDFGGEGELFSVQPIRRSFSMDSAAGHELYSAVERTSILKTSEESSSSRIQGSIFPVRQGRG